MESQILATLIFLLLYLMRKVTVMSNLEIAIQFVKASKVIDTTRTSIVLVNNYTI